MVSNLFDDLYWVKVNVRYMAVLNAEIERRAAEAAKALARRGTVIAAYVFGSHPAGRANEWSDIDVAAFMEGVESWDLWHRTQIIVQVQKEVGYDIELHLFPASSLQNPQAGSFAADVLKKEFEYCNYVRKQILVTISLV